MFPIDRIIAIIFAILAATGLAACNNAEADTSKDNTSEHAELPEPDTDTTDDTDHPEAAFGDAFEYRNGVTVRVDPAGDVTPSEWAITGEGFNAHKLFEVTITNGSDEAYSPYEFTSSVLSGGVAGEEIYDSEQGLEGSPMIDTLLPGKSVTFKTAYSVMDPEDIAFMAATGFEYRTVTFS